MLKTRLAASRRRRSLQLRSALYFPAPLDTPRDCGDAADAHAPIDWHNPFQKQDRHPRVDADDLLTTI